MDMENIIGQMEEYIKVFIFIFIFKQNKLYWFYNSFKKGTGRMNNGMGRENWYIILAISIEVLFNI
jgi:hypothetical protein